MDNVILIGMPGAGKSTVGVLLAKTLGYGFVDTDLLLQRREGALLQTLLDARGAGAFLDAEEEVISKLDCRRTVIAPGGSAVCRESAMARLRELGTVVYLRLSCSEIEKRLADIHTRGVVMSPGQTIRNLYDARTALYPRYADLIVDAGGRSPEEIVSAVLHALSDYQTKEKGFHHGF